MFKNAYIILTAIVLLVLVHLVIYTKTANVGYEIGASKRTLSGIRSENRSLAAIAASERSLERIDKIARGSLKMVTPVKINYIVITEESR